jgi:DNA-binding response OmpR family regulator
MNTHLLLLEDDPVSAAFLHQVLASLPARVTHAASLASARALACRSQQLWLFDARLPDGHSRDLLAELRARGLDTPALALTADDSPAVLQALRAAGFLDALAKPLSASALLASVRGHLPPTHGAPAWDDAAALAALGGQPASVAALRALFLQELPNQVHAVSACLAQGHRADAQSQLHRLKASCALVGALPLLDAVRRLSLAPDDGEARRHFEQRAADLLDA